MRTETQEPDVLTLLLDYCPAQVPHGQLAPPEQPTQAQHGLFFVGLHAAHAQPSAWSDEAHEAQAQDAECVAVAIMRTEEAAPRLATRSAPARTEKACAKKQVTEGGAVCEWHGEGAGPRE